METITLTYDSNNNVIKKLLEALFAAGAIEKKSGIEEAIEDFETGNTIKCKDFHDFLIKMNE